MQNPSYNHKEMKEKVGVSNLKMFDGEDLTGGDRRRLQQMQMNDWIKQQSYENNQKMTLNKEIQKAYDNQTLDINNMVIALEEEQRRRRIEMEIANQQANVQMMKEKLDREEMQQKLATLEKQDHQNHILNHDLWTENTQTCQSQLAPHRVIPYHYKGMNDEQRDAIREEQERQRQENEKKKREQKENEKMWAMYNEVKK